MYEIDKLDLKIVDLLMKDGRMTAAEIARHIGGEISERVVRYRIKRLVEEDVIFICAIPNPRALGLEVVADVFVEVEPAHIEQVARALVEHERVSYLACSIGERDVSVQVVARDNAEVYAFATEFIGKLPGVRKTTTSIVPLTLKDVYQWQIPASLARDDSDAG
ncbi:MAG: Lrp/AsnC family transcriptional regulator [Anaerolineales bacterium]|nr:Lrp/AsnC family transcriptional regulator [Anaerolineales bacterium]